MRNASNVVDAAESLWDFMQLQAGERVVITADTRSDRGVAQALMDAARRKGAPATLVTMAPLPYQGGLADPYITQSCAQAVAGAEVWVDITFPYMAGSAVHDEAMGGKKTRYLLLGDVTEDVFSRLFGDTDLDTYFQAQEQFDVLIREGRGQTCRITDPAGTDVSFTLGESGLHKPRHAAQPGMYVVPGSCSIPPEIDTVKGKIAIGAVFHTHYELLQQPIVVHVDNKIQKVEGAGASVMAFERALKRAVQDGFGSVIHFTHGLLPRARVTGRSFIEDMRVMGNNAVGFGVPWWLPGGGENHPDGVVFGHSIWIGDRQIVRDGAIVWPEDLATLTNQIEL